jgi:hypothetical protein
MRGACPACGAPDPGFDWVTCPNCSAPAPGAEEEYGRASRRSGSDPSWWEPTGFGSSQARGSGARSRRTVFDDSPNYYEDLRGGGERGGLRFDDDQALFDLPEIDPTEIGDEGEAPKDRTIFDRGGRDAWSDDEESDHTVIVRGGRRGVTGPLVYFVERNGMRAGKVWRVGPTTLIGRRRSDDEDEASIILNDETVSRRHGKVVVEDGEFYYWDLASANGSFHMKADGSRRRILEPHRLSDGDTIDVGEARITFLVVDKERVDEAFE